MAHASGRKMIFTGGPALSNPVSNAQVAATVAASLGVPQADIILLDRPRDTDDEAQEVKNRRAAPVPAGDLCESYAARDGLFPPSGLIAFGHAGKSNGDRLAA